MLPTRKELEGRPHIVANMVMLQVGTFSGSSGPVFYPDSELGKNVTDWDGRPVVVFHPTLNDEGVSANAPQTVNQYKVGVIFNTRFDGRKLTAEAWLDEARLKALSPDSYIAASKGKQLEISTGLYFDYNEHESTSDGAIIARNLRPDHLALLPGKRGACSIAHGCGLHRNSTKQTSQLAVHEYSDADFVLELPSWE